MELEHLALAVERKLLLKPVSVASDRLPKGKAPDLGLPGRAGGI